MALTRKMLKAMGIGDEQIDEIIEAHTETVNALKNERDEYKDKAEKLGELESQVEKDPYKVKYEAIKDEFEKYKSEITAKNTHETKEKAYREMLKKIGVSEKRIDSILRISDVDSIEFLQNGNIKGADSLEQNLKTEWADFIPAETNKPATPDNPPQNPNTEPPREHRAAKIAAEYYKKMYGEKT